MLGTPNSAFSSPIRRAKGGGQHISLEDLDDLNDQHIIYEREARAFSSKHEGHAGLDMVMESGYEPKPPPSPESESGSLLLVPALQRQRLQLERNLVPANVKLRQFLAKADGYGRVGSFDVEYSDAGSPIVNEEEEEEEQEEADFQARHTLRQNRRESDEAEGGRTPQGSAGCMGLAHGLIDFFTCSGTAYRPLPPESPASTGSRRADEDLWSSEGTESDDHSTWRSVISRPRTPL